MSAASSQEWELVERHEKILGRRAELLERMEAGRERLASQRKQKLEEVEAAHSRNASLLQDLEIIEEHLRGRHLPHPSLQALETRYWASVEEFLPAWENFLLGKGPHPTDGHGQSTARRAKQRLSPAKDHLRPPLPKLKTGI